MSNIFELIVDLCCDWLKDLDWEFLGQFMTNFIYIFDLIVDLSCDWLKDDKFSGQHFRLGIH